MINKENLNKLYEGIINEHELTTKELNSYGFHSKDISDLIEQRIIERVKRGHYSFLATNNLYYYGKKLLGSKESEKADICFKKCYELDHTHIGTCFQLFIRSIKAEDYDKAFEYFETLFNTDNKYYKADSNLYLYLLSIISDIPEKYKEYTRYLTLEDIKVDSQDKRYKDIPLQNKIRQSILQRKIPYAIKQHNDLVAQNKSNTVQDMIIRILMYQALEQEKEKNNTIISLIKEQRYEELQSFLKNKQKKYNLSLLDKYTLILTEDLLNIKESNIIPEKKIVNSENMFDAIDGYDYKLALKLNKIYSIKNNFLEEKNPILLLLNDVCNMIDKIKQQPKKEFNTKKEVNFSDIINYLMNKDIDNAINSLKDYMSLINKSDYEFLIINLIKLSLLEKDLAFTKPMTALTYISRNNYNFDISNYLEEFYISLSQNNFKVAKIYLDIISNIEKLNKESNFTENLSQVLNKKEQTINKKMITKKINLITDSNQPHQEKANNHNIEQVMIPNENQDEYYPLSNGNDSNYCDSIDKEVEFINNKYQQLIKNKGIILLKPMNSERRKIIHDIVQEYPDVTSFEIGKFENTKIVLKYSPSLQENIDIEQLLNEAKTMHNSHNYTGALKKYLKALQISEPNPHIYGMLGLIYMKKGDKEKAIDYLTIATFFGTQGKKHYQCDYSELIDCLKGNLSTEERKPKFFMKKSDFNTSTTNFNIENFDEINTYILNSNKDVESACQELNMTDEKITKIKLLYAIEYYTQGEFTKGDEFLNDVEKSQNKSDFIKKQLEEIRKRKKFYKNRIQEQPKKLSLILKPKNK